MRKSLTTRRYGKLVLLALTLGCENWPGDGTSGGGPDPGPSTPVGRRCTSVTADEPDAPSVVNGAFCFGVAAFGTNYLGCTQIGGEIQCLDEVAGVAYLVSWTGNRGAARNLAGQNLGAIDPVQTDSYEIELAAGALGVTEAAGVCTIDRLLGVARFCEYE